MHDHSAGVSENYLKQIYTLSLDETPVRTTRLAQALHLSPAAVTEMLKRLVEQGLIDYQPYRGAVLTDEGKRNALSVLRRHRLWEVFLHDVLDVPWGELHEHAERLEHATNPRLANYLDAFLGRPRFDPHGHPIPDAAGQIVEVDRLRLADLEPGATAVITQCTNDTPTLLQYLKDLGLMPGVSVIVGQRAPFGGPMSVSIAGKEQLVGPEAARTLLVARREK